MHGPVAVFVTAVLALTRASEAAKPNIILIVADDYGWNDIGYHGSEIRTPTLDRLAAGGVKLDNYYVQPRCGPSRGQLLSGRYQIHTGLQSVNLAARMPNGLPLEIPTIADKLREQGYATHAIGKWHLGFYQKEFTPTFRGFDSFYGFYTGALDYFTHMSCSDYKYLDREACGLDFHDNLKPDWSKDGQYSTHVFTERAEQLVEQHVRNTPDKPFFLYLPYQATHSPMQVPDEYTEQYRDINQRRRKIYAGMASCMDEAVANLTQTLQQMNMWDNTVVVFTTDNGGQVHQGGNNWPLRGMKTTLWEGGVRGVGFVHSPLITRTGRVSRGLMHISDWFPTLVGLAGGSTRGMALDGFDMWNTIRRGAPSPREEILLNIDPLMKPRGRKRPDSPFDVRVRAALKVGKWKLITGDPGDDSWVPPPHLQRTADTGRRAPANKNLWLFDLEKDPNEREDVSESNPAVVERMLVKLAAYNATAVPAIRPSSDDRSNPELHGGVWGPWIKSKTFTTRTNEVTINATITEDPISNGTMSDTSSGSRVEQSLFILMCLILPSIGSGQMIIH